MIRISLHGTETLHVAIGKKLAKVQTSVNTAMSKYSMDYRNRVIYYLSGAKWDKNKKSGRVTKRTGRLAGSIRIKRLQNNYWQVAISGGRNAQLFRLFNEGTEAGWPIFPKERTGGSRLAVPLKDLRVKPRGYNPDPAYDEDDEPIDFAAKRYHFRAGGNAYMRWVFHPPQRSYDITQKALRDTSAKFKQRIDEALVRVRTK